MTKSPNGILPTEKGILGSLKFGYWDINLDTYVLSLLLSLQVGISTRAYQVFEIWIYTKSPFEASMRRM